MRGGGLLQLRPLEGLSKSLNTTCEKSRKVEPRGHGAFISIKVFICKLIYIYIYICLYMSMYVYIYI